MAGLPAPPPRDGGLGDKGPQVSSCSMGPVLGGWPSLTSPQPLCPGGCPSGIVPLDTSLVFQGGPDVAPPALPFPACAGTSLPLGQRVPVGGPRPSPPWGGFSCCREQSARRAHTGPATATPRAACGPQARPLRWWLGAPHAQLPGLRGQRCPQPRGRRTQDGVRDSHLLCSSPGDQQPYGSRWDVRGPSGLHWGRKNRRARAQLATGGTESAARPALPRLPAELKTSPAQGKLRP